MKAATLLLALLLLSGCAAFENRVACTPDGKAFFLSEYHRVAVGSTIVDRDAKVICTKIADGK